MYEDFPLAGRSLKRLRGANSNDPLTGQYRLAYPALILQRQQLLDIMSGKLQGRGHIKTSSRICSINETPDSVMLNTVDGTSVTADLVIGADGVRSCVRQHIDKSAHGLGLSSDQCKYTSTRYQQ